MPDQWRLQKATDERTGIAFKIYTKKNHLYKHDLDQLIRSYLQFHPDQKVSEEVTLYDY